MKKLLGFTSACLLFILLSCTDATTTTDVNTKDDASMAERNKIKNRIVMEAIGTGDMAAVDTIIAEDAIDHSGPGMTDIKGRDSIKAILSKVKSCFKDYKLDIISEAAEGDYVFALSRMTGTTTENPGMGMPPNTKIDMTGVDVTRFKDGKAVEHWSYMDPKDVMKMMPQGTGQNMPIKVDTAVKK